ncbi:unnamed protein product [Lactuca virosa]|uniref:Uncharacterized protein n=1 Tax=Lactuca virosa TaxID=75947 RepID=A0AAU9MK99_9ASTR|nr:unnamed protein product [Lactuca virosa]
MVAGISRSPTTLIIVFSLTILLLWYTTTTTTIIFRQPPPTVKGNHIVKEKQQDQHYRSLLTRRVLINRKVLSPTANFDFTPFLHGDHHQHHQHPAAVPEIDQRYGVEMRLVPTGPNPLHH